MKNFLILAFILALMVGCQNKSNVFTALVDRPCLDHVIDVKLMSFRQAGLQNMTFVFSLPGVNTHIKNPQTYTLSVQMIVRDPHKERLWVVPGEGSAQNITWIFEGTIPKVNIPVSYTREGGDINSLSNLIRDAVKDGFERLQIAMKDEQEIWQTTVNNISDDGQIHIQADANHPFQQGDFFNIYSVDFLRQAHSVKASACHKLKFGPSDLLATARITDIMDAHITLEVAQLYNKQKSIQMGDIVEAFPNAYKNKNEDQSAIQVQRALRLGVVHNSHITIKIHNHIYRVNIADRIQNALLAEGPHLGFQITP